jgi:hypothetical protein
VNFLGSPERAADGRLGSNPAARSLSGEPFSVTQLRIRNGSSCPKRDLAGTAPGGWISAAPLPDRHALMGDIRFAPPEVYEFADTIFKLIDNGFINSVSVGFLPLEFEFADDRLGINFIRQTLLEISVVPVPANAHALIEAKGWNRGPALIERPTPALSTMSFSGTAKERRWYLANALKQALKRG